MQMVSFQSYISATNPNAVEPSLGDEGIAELGTGPVSPTVNLDTSTALYEGVYNIHATGLLKLSSCACANISLWLSWAMSMMLYANLRTRLSSHVLYLSYS